MCRSDGIGTYSKLLKWRISFSKRRCPLARDMRYSALFWRLRRTWSGMAFRRIAILCFARDLSENGFPRRINSEDRLVRDRARCPDSEVRKAFADSLVRTWGSGL